MQTDETVSERIDGTGTPEDERQRTLERLADMVRLSHEVTAMRAGDRPVPLPLMRRAVFAAYRAAVEAGAEAEARRILHEDNRPAPAAM